MKFADQYGKAGLLTDVSFCIFLYFFLLEAPFRHLETVAAPVWVPRQILSIRWPLCSTYRRSWTCSSLLGLAQTDVQCAKAFCSHHLVSVFYYAWLLRRGYNLAQVRFYKPQQPGCRSGVRGRSKVLSKSWQKDCWSDSETVWASLWHYPLVI